MTVNIDCCRTVEPMAIDEMKHLHTGSLLSRLKLLRSLQDSFDVSDWLPEERDAVEAAGLIAFKESEIWKKAFSDVQELLAQREHLPRGSKEKRKQEAFHKQNR